VPYGSDCSGVEAFKEGLDTSTVVAREFGNVGIEAPHKFSSDLEANTAAIQYLVQNVRPEVLFLDMFRAEPSEKGKAYPDNRLVEVPRNISIYMNGGECSDFTRAMRKENKEEVILTWSGRLDQSPSVHGGKTAFAPLLFVHLASTNLKKLRSGAPGSCSEKSPRVKKTFCN